MVASLGKLGVGSYPVGLCVEEGSGTGVSPYEGPVGNLERRGPCTGDFENYLKLGSSYGASVSI